MITIHESGFVDYLTFALVLGVAGFIIGYGVRCVEQREEREKGLADGLTRSVVVELESGSDADSESVPDL